MIIKPPATNRSVMLIGGKSGSGVNLDVVPEKAFFTIDRRINPEEKLDAAKKQLMQIFDVHKRQDSEIEIETIQEGESSITS